MWNGLCYTTGLLFCKLSIFCVCAELCFAHFLTLRSTTKKSNICFFPPTWISSPSCASWGQQGPQYFTWVNKNVSYVSFPPSILQPQLQAVIAYEESFEGQRSFPKTRNCLWQEVQLLSGEVDRLAVDWPHCHICFRGDCDTVVEGWEQLRSLWPLSYTKQMRTGVALLFWEFLGKPQLAGRPQNMRIWVWSNLLQRTFPHLIHVRNAQFMVLEMQLVVCWTLRFNPTRSPHLERLRSYWEMLNFHFIH